MTTAPDQEPGGTAIRPLFPDVATWVDNVYAVTYVRRLSQSQRWCARWWAHSEAIVRLTCLWRTWESARAATYDAAMADWHRLYFDAINPVLLSPDGPFASCTVDRHRDSVPLPLTQPPAGYWSDLD
jgi:hypothetical protein